jgi:hypothetical protein
VTFAVVTAGGVQPISFTWRKDAIALPPVQQPGGPVLTLASVVEGDEGNYDVVASDAGSDVVSSLQAFLNVADSPLSINQQPAGARGYTVPPMALGAHTLTVGVTGGIAPVTYLWKKDGAPAPGTNDQADYVIDPATPADSGLYTCDIVDATEALLVSGSALVEVDDHIAFTDQPEGGSVAEGASFAFDVAVSGGLGTLEYVWQFEGIAKAPQEVGTGDTLNLTDLQIADSGDYYVEVSDDFETFTSDTARLEVATAIPLGSLAGLILFSLFAAIGAAGVRRKTVRT